MYLSVCRKALNFMHKHDDIKVVCGLDFIAQASCDVFPLAVSSHFLPGWTDLELSLLYKHVTGRDTVPYVGNMLKAALAEYAEEFPVTDCVPHEVEAQELYVESLPDEDDVKLNWFYVKGSNKPGRKPSIWGKVVRVAIRPDADMQKAIQARITAQAVHAQVQAHALAQATARAATQAPAQPRPARVSAGAPRSGVCKAIWEALAAERERSGEIPSRDWIKQHAQTQGWNSNTASVQYAAWKKANA